MAEAMIGALIGFAIYIAAIGCAWAIVIAGRPDPEEQAREDVLQAAWLRELQHDRQQRLHAAREGRRR